MNFLTSDTLRFLNQLVKNNNKEWFDAHRAEYESNVKKPFRDLVEALIERMIQVDPFFECRPQDAIFRINRDVRFSANKAPYKTNVAAAVGPGGRKGEPGFYMHIEGKKMLVGGGAYDIDPATLTSIRNFQLQHPKAIHQAVNDKNFKTVFTELLGEKNKVLPPLYKEAAQENPYLYYKQMYFMTEMPSKDFIACKDQVELLFHHFLCALPVLNVLRDAMSSAVKSSKKTR